MVRGELNVEVTDRDDTKKLEEWFIERWEDNFSLDISQDLIKVIDESWAGKQLPPFIFISRWLIICRRKHGMV